MQVRRRDRKRIQPFASSKSTKMSAKLTNVAFGATSWQDHTERVPVVPAD
jgi:hypothetical protein